MEKFKPEQLKEKRPQDVISFLREYNFGSRDESPRKAVERFLDHMEERNPIDVDMDAMFNVPRENFTKIDLLVTVLEDAGFVVPGAVSHYKWTDNAVQALNEALKDFEGHPADWQKEVSKGSVPWV